MLNPTSKNKGNNEVDTNLQGVKEGLMDSANSQGEEVISPQDDETCRLHQIYNLQSSYKIDIQVDQVSQGKRSPLPIHTGPEEQHWIDMRVSSLELRRLFHSVVMFHKTEQFVAGAADSLKTKQTPVDPRETYSMIPVTTHKQILTEYQIWLVIYLGGNRKKSSTKPFTWSNA